MAISVLLTASLKRLLEERLWIAVEITLSSVSCKLGLIETTEPTGGSQHRDREYWGGPTNGRAATCRRRLAAVEDTSLADFHFIL